MELSIKQLRRIEAELVNEKEHVMDRVNEYGRETCDDAESASTNGERILGSNIIDIKAIIDAQYCIRKLISDFNESAGINNRTLQIAYLEAVMEARSGLMNSVGKVRANTDYYSKKISYTNGIKDEYEDALRAEERSDKRQIQRLKDSCNGINSSSKVEIPESLLTIITKYGLIDLD